MTPAIRKYYVLVPAALSHDGKPYWQELSDVKSITFAQFYVNRIFGGIPSPEIAVSFNGGDKTVVSKKNTNGKWEVVTADKQ